MDDKAIQIGVSKDLGHYYVDAVTQIEDVTELAHEILDAHHGYDETMGGTKEEFTKVKMTEM